MKPIARLIVWAGTIVGAMLPVVLMSAYILAASVRFAPEPVWATPFHAHLMPWAFFSLVALCGYLGFAITKSVVGQRPAACAKSIQKAKPERSAGQGALPQRLLPHQRVG